MSNVMIKKHVFSKEHRICHVSEFDRIFGTGRCVGQKYLVGFYLPNSLGYSRLGMSIGRKFGCSPDRNTWKRMIREAFRISDFRWKYGVDLVFIPSKKNKTLLWHILQRDVQNIINKVVNDSHHT